jgi:hypothetical protein
MDGLLEYKSIFGGIKDLDSNKRIVTGYLSEFGSKDHDNDIIEKGAFKKSISERKNDIFFLNHHKWDQPHGKFDILIEDSKGLYFESEPFIDTTYSSDLIKLYAAGIIKEHSIGFSTVKQDIDKRNYTRTLKELKLYEGSNVTMGANPNTPFTGFKSKTISEINDQVSLILKAVRTGTFTDETFMQLEIALKQLQLESYELGKKALEEPSDDDTQDNEPLIIEQIKSFRQSLII